MPLLSHRAGLCSNPGRRPRETVGGERRQETAPTSPTSAQLPLTGHLATSTPRNGHGLAIRSRLWLARPAYPAIRPPSIAVSGGEPATSGSSGLYVHSIRTPFVCQALFAVALREGMMAAVPHHPYGSVAYCLSLVLRHSR